MGLKEYVAMAALGTALAGPVYADKPVEEVTLVKATTEASFDIMDVYGSTEARDPRLDISNFDLMNMYSSSKTRDPRLDTSNMDFNGLELAAVTPDKSESNWSARPTISPDGKNIGVQVGLRYTGGPVKEFFWGATRPLHLYNHDEHTGKLEILPFYLDCWEEGGFASPLNPNAWERNPSLTLGALTADIAIVGTAIALSQSGGSSSDSSDNTYNPVRDGVQVGTTSTGLPIYQNPSTGEVSDASGDTSYTGTGGSYTYVPTSDSGSFDDTSITDPDDTTGGASGGTDGNTGDVPVDPDNDPTVNPF